MTGIGLTMEGIEQNPVMYELLIQNVWQKDPVNLKSWLEFYIRNRYGILDSQAVKAWDVLRQTAYNGKVIRDGAESIVTGRPTFDSTTVWTRTKLNYDPKDFIPAWDYMIKASGNCGNSDGFQYDLVDVTRQALANYALVVHKKFAEAYFDKDAVAFKKYSGEFLQIIADMDALLGTRKDFLLGQWIADARSFGNNEEEKALYERNAKDLITLWGDANSPLHEYSCRQWSGLLDDFYKARWELFFKSVNESLSSGKPFDTDAFGKYISSWEWKWVNERKDYPVKPTGNSIDQSTALYKKYVTEIKAAY
jgi:alpha-N-acetylglucosaminidase